MVRNQSRSLAILIELVVNGRRHRVDVDPDPLAVGEIGYLLGFSEPSAFQRAFRRWHRLSPLAYRRSQSMRE
jgi:AraC-like DNA-binding protein